MLPEQRQPQTQIVSSKKKPETATGNLLNHLTEFGVVICRTCQFAVQPNALSSHLLRHQIYRSERRQLLDHVSRLGLLEPKMVPIPSPSTPPLPDLPVYQGYKCNVAGCTHTCISQKRMSQHWSELHDQSNSRNVDARSVFLQTFFRGTHIRYFEVRGPSIPLTPNGVPEDASLNREPLPPSSEMQSFFIPTSSQDPFGADSNPLEHAIHEEPIKILPLPLDMNLLRHLHQYITYTSLTVSRGTESTDFWTHIILEQAFKYEFLMYGILGVAACHLSMENSQLTAIQMHQQAGIQYQSAGVAGFRLAMAQPTSENCEALIAFSRLLGVQRCVQALVELDEADKSFDKISEGPTSPIIEFLMLMRGGCETLLALQTLLPLGSGFILPENVRKGLQALPDDQRIATGHCRYLLHALTERLEASFSNDFRKQLASPKICDFIQEIDMAKLCCEALCLSSELEITKEWIQKVIPNWPLLETESELLIATLRASLRQIYTSHLQAQTERNFTQIPPLYQYPNLTPSIYNQLTSLLYNLCTLFPPQNIPDIYATTLAITALLESFSRSYASPDQVWALWNGIESWPRMIPPHFMNMLEAGRPAALVVFAHWCCMIRGVEAQYWFVKGQSNRLLGIVLKNLQREGDVAAAALVKGLL